MQDAKVGKEETGTDEKRKRMRSPAYPYISLESAIKRAREFHEREGRNAANIRVTVKHWGYEEKSSSGLQTVAALVSFGLMQDEGTGEKRKLQLTPKALRILLDTDPLSTARVDAIKACALAPKVHQDLWNKYKWGTNPPSDASLANVLTFEWEPPFNEKSVGGFIRQFKETIAFAKLSDSDTLSAEGDDKGSERAVDGGQLKYIPKVGDFVQWEPKGVLQFPEAKRISSLSSDGKYAFVEGSNNGISCEELTKQTPPVQTVPPAGSNSANSLSQNATMREFVYSLDEGKAVFQWPTPLSAESITELKDWLKILERKITKSAIEGAPIDRQEKSES
jgi:hypothetical protein